MKKIIVSVSLIFLYLVGIMYFLAPSPSTPNLANDLQSDEPGDTWQHPDQKAFFTDLNRSMVMADLQNKFSVRLQNFVFPSYRLNYRPENVGTLVRDQLRSYYLEEIVYPMRESLFVSGWEPRNSPIYKGYFDKDKPKIIIGGREYLSKVTLRPVRSHPSSRILVWTLCFPAAYLIYLSYKSIKDA